jgi:16S rRNA (cytidine1402-2'-O)-methyltransferase
MEPKPNMPKFFVVATPIGNLNDISKRALDILKRVDFILAEDTRRTKKLLNAFHIKTPVISYHQHSRLRKVEQILNYLKEDRNLALVTDAGTPGISDPGNQLIAEVVKTTKTKIIPIPGPCALTAIASVSGLPLDKFLFLGFPPNKKKRKKFFKKIEESEYPVIIYESCHRILKTLNELHPDFEIVLGRELTKKFETIYRGKPKIIIEKLNRDSTKGEFVIVIRGQSPEAVQPKFPVNPHG